MTINERKNIKILKDMLFRLRQNRADVAEYNALRSAIYIYQEKVNDPELRMSKVLSKCNIAADDLGISEKQFLYDVYNIVQRLSDEERIQQWLRLRHDETFENTDTLLFILRAPQEDHSDIEYEWDDSLNIDQNIEAAYRAIKGF